MCSRPLPPSATAGAGSATAADGRLRAPSPPRLLLRYRRAFYSEFHLAMDHARLARFEKQRVKKTREEKEYQRDLKEKDKFHDEHTLQRPEYLAILALRRESAATALKAIKACGIPQSAVF